MEAHDRVIQILSEIDKEKRKSLLSHFWELAFFLPELQTDSDAKEQIHEQTLAVLDIDEKKVFLHYVDSYFDISNYEDLDPEDLSAWAFQLWLRRSTFDYFNLAEQYSNQKNSRTAHMFYRLMATRNLFLILFNANVNKEYFENEFFDFIPHIKKPNSSVAELTIASTFNNGKRHFLNGDFDRFRHFFSDAKYPDMHNEPDEFKEFMVEKRKVAELGNIPIDQDVQFQEGENLPYSHHVHPEIDLRHSDDQIKEDFEKYLKTIRKRTGIKPERAKKVSLSNVNSLNKHKVLPYLDLSLVAKYLYTEIESGKYGLGVGQKEIGELLFFEEHYLDKGTDVKEKTKDSTAPHASRAMQKEFIASLLVQSGCYVYPD